MIASMAKGDVSKMLDTIGLDMILAWLEQGDSIHKIASRLGTSIGAIRHWVARDTVRSARMRDARVAGAEWWEERAIKVLHMARVDAAANPLIASAIVALAREEAQACWRCAAVRDPERYDTRRSEKIAININQDMPGGARALTTAELQRIASTAAATDVVDADVREISHRQS
jgi:hypothetical protein